jgi:ribonucleoside-diphosphate reductase beta chain
MLGSADMIRYIQRDEEGTHLELFAHCFMTLQIERPELFDMQFYKDVAGLVDAAVELESTWGAHIIEGGVLGLTPAIINDYVKYRADYCLAKIGIAPMYGVKNPVAWVEKFSRINATETNFFEGKPASYQVGGQLAW